MVDDIEERRLEAEVSELRSALAREERISKALREVGTALGTTLDLDDLLELILGKLTELLDAERSTLYLLDEARGDLVSRIVIGRQVRSIRIKVGHGIAGTVAKTGKSIRVEDAYEDPRFEAEWDMLTGFKTTSMLAAPLKNHLGRTIGVIQVLNKRVAGGFTSEDEAILGALSMQAAVAIDNSRLFLSQIQKNKQLLEIKEELERRVRDLELLFELERSTARAATLDDLVLAALESAASACDARGAAMLVAEEGSGDLVIYVHDQGREKSLDRFGIKSDEGLLSLAMSEDVRLEFGQAESHRGFHPRVEGRFTFPVQSMLAVALEAGQVAFGALGVFSKGGQRSFSDDDLSLVRLIGANVSTALRLFRASEARERGERLTTIGRLLSQVIHDFKTPMTVISGYVQLMSSENETSKREEYAEQILKQFDMLTSMQREVLEFARGERNVFVRKVYLHKFMNEIRQQLTHEIDGRAFDLEMDVDNKIVARFDEARLARALHNLARNALEAMASQGGKLTIRATMDHSDLVISVSDTGPGIPTEVEGRLFQSFVTAGKKGGTGLGLAIVKKIVEEHGGTIEVTSTNRGATFELRLPQEGAASPARPLAKARKKAPATSASEKRE